MTIQDQYLETVRQTQETWAEAVKSYTNDLQRSFTQPSSAFGYIDPNETIDKVFDSQKKSLEVQRDLTKQLVRKAISASEKFSEQVESVSAALRQQADSVNASR